MTKIQKKKQKRTKRKLNKQRSKRKLNKQRSKRKNRTRNKYNTYKKRKKQNKKIKTKRSSKKKKRTKKIHRMRGGSGNESNPSQPIAVWRERKAARRPIIQPTDVPVSGYSMVDEGKAKPWMVDPRALGPEMRATAAQRAADVGKTIDLELEVGETDDSPHDVRGVLEASAFESEQNPEDYEAFLKFAMLLGSAIKMRDDDDNSKPMYPEIGKIDYFRKHFNKCISDIDVHKERLRADWTEAALISLISEKVRDLALQGHTKERLMEIALNAGATDEEVEEIDEQGDEGDIFLNMGQKIKFRGKLGIEMTQLDIMLEILYYNKQKIIDILAKSGLDLENLMVDTDLFEAVVEHIGNNVFTKYPDFSGFNFESEYIGKIIEEAEVENEVDVYKFFNNVLLMLCQKLLDKGDMMALEEILTEDRGDSPGEPLWVKEGEDKLKSLAYLDFD